MLLQINRLIDILSNFFAQRKGLLPFVGILLVMGNLLLQLLPINGWVVESNFLLHLGLILAVLGLMLAWAL